MPTSSSRSPAAASASRFEIRSCACIMSTNWSPTRITGLSEFIALWKTIETLRQRNLRSSFGAQPARSSPRKRMLPADDVRRRAEDLHQRVRDGALAAARLAGEPDDLAGADRQVDAVDRAHAAFAAVLDLESAQLEERLRRSGLASRGHVGQTRSRLPPPAATRLPAARSCARRDVAFSRRAGAGCDLVDARRA